MPTFRNHPSVPSSKAGYEVWTGKGPVYLGPGINTGPFPVISTLHIQPLKMELIDGSETSAFKNQTPGIHPKDYSQYSKHGESLKSRIIGSCNINSS
jgi:hypothetical protein